MHGRDIELAACVSRPLRFVLRPGVAIEVGASLAAAANAMPHPDACAWFAVELAAAQRERLEPRGWLTLREAAALIGCDFDEAYYRLRSVLDAEHCDPLSCVRSVGRWELVSAANLARFIVWAKSRGCRRDDVTAVDAAHYADELAAERERREVETALVDGCSARWRFSDGTRVGLGGHVDGGSRFACALRRALRDRLGVEIGPHPDGGRWIEPTELAYFDLWLRQRSSFGYWLHPQLTLIERPADVPALPRRRRSKLPPGAIA